MNTNIFSSWIATGILLFDSWVIHRGENLWCAFANVRQCKSYEKDPTEFSMLAIFLIVFSVFVYLLPSIPKAKSFIKSTIADHGIEANQQELAEEIISERNISLITSLISFVAALLLTVLLLLQLWGVAC